MKKTALFFACLITIVFSSAQSWQDTVQQIEKIFSRYKSTIPGAELAISRNGKIIFTKAWGMADLEHNVPLTTESITEAGSVSKQFTAAAMLLLEQQGKLSMDDDVRKYIPELPDYGYKISLRQMMQHKSGFKDWGAIAGLAGWPRSTKTYNNDDALYIMTNQKTLNYKPGDEYLYSNSNYNLFAIIVQRVSGMSLTEFTRKNIFEPAGMKHTQWRDNYKRIVPNRAIAYSKSGSTYQTNMPNEYAYGNGGLLTTAEDLVTWCNYYLNGKLGSPSLLDKQLATTALNSGIMHSYAAGLFLGKFRGWKSISHDGATASYRANLEAYPELGLAIAWLSNSSEFDNDTVNVAELIGNFFVPGTEPPATRDNPKEITLATEKLNHYVGWYKNLRTAAATKVFIQDNKLRTNNGFLIPVGENVFMGGPNRIVFGKKNLLVITSAKDSIYFMAMDSAKLDAQAMNEYVGEYYSDEAEARYFIAVKNSRLVIFQKFKPELMLTPTYKDGFDTPVGTIFFEREKNKIVNFRIFVSRARNVEFRKIK